MSGKTATKGFIAEGMTCASCEKIICRQALKVEGVKSCKIDYTTQEGTVTFDSSKTDIDTILSKIEEKGYTCYILKESGQQEKSSNPLGWVFWIIGLLVTGYFILKLVDRLNIPEISQNMGYGLLFVVGLLTGFHCVAMCGGFVVSYTAKDAKEGRKPHQSHIMYSIGKLISYTTIGALFGLLGSIIAFTPFMRGIAGVIAGLFLILFGLNMLNVFPVLRKIQFRTPEFIAKFVGEESRKSSSPLAIGLLNGLMIACGPLQAMYVMAAGTGSMIEGAKLLFIFGLGTLPVMLGFGYLATFISGKMTHKILKVSGVIVIILGLIMLNRGLALAGTGYDFKSIISSISVSPEDLNSAGNAGSDNLNNIAVQKDGYQEIRMDVTYNGWEPDKFVLKKGVPVRWIINGKGLTSCNSAIVVPKYSLNFKIKPGEQVIEFTPTETGIVPWSCWMGMMQGTFIVKDDTNFNNQADIQKELNAVKTPKGGTCGMGGACTCGGAR